MRRSTIIVPVVTSNPHQRGSLRYRRWLLLQPGMTVGEFYRVHSGANFADPSQSLGDRIAARDYLTYLLRHGYIQLPGEPERRRATRQPTLPTTPLTGDLSGFTFGAEIECILPRGLYRGEAARRLTAAGVDCFEESYNHHTRPHWKVTTDRSLGNMTRGAEFVSPILRGEEGLRQLEKVCNLLKEMGAKATHACGFHVHVGGRGHGSNFLSSLLRLYGRNETLIDRLVPESRRADRSRWCGSVANYRITDEMDATAILRAFPQKWRKVNLTPYTSRGTVEFRQASGTVDADKASFWVKFCLRMVNAARASRQQKFDTLDELLAAVGCTEDEKRYLTGRAASLNPPTAQLPIPAFTG